MHKDKRLDDSAGCGRQKNEGILLANLLQRSRTAFSCVSFSNFFAFKEGMYDTQVSAVLSSPTVSEGFLDRCPTRTLLIVDHPGRLILKVTYNIVLTLWPTSDNSTLC